MVRKVFASLLLILGAVISIEVMSMAFTLMNKANTLSFYGGLVLFLVSFATIATLGYKFGKSIAKSIKNN